MEHGALSHVLNTAYVLAQVLGLGSPRNSGAHCLRKEHVACGLAAEREVVVGAAKGHFTATRVQPDEAGARRGRRVFQSSQMGRMASGQRRPTRSIASTTRVSPPTRRPLSLPATPFLVPVVSETPTLQWMSSR